MQKELKSNSLVKKPKIYEYDDIDYAPDGEVYIVYPDGTRTPLNPDIRLPKESNPKKE